jgi:hypothetical protein
MHETVRLFGRTVACVQMDEERTSAMRSRAHGVLEEAKGIVSDDNVLAKQLLDKGQCSSCDQHSACSNPFATSCAMC